MSDWALFWGVAALLCAAYALHGGWLAQRWGVDPSRKTPTTLEAQSKRHRGGAGLFVIGYVITGFLGSALITGAMMDCEGWWTAAALFAWSVACGTLGFAALFASVRSAKSVPKIAEEELFPGAKRIMYALELILTASAAGFVVVQCFAGDGEWQLSNAYVFAIGSVFWLAVSAMIPSQMIAPRIRSERSMQRASYGGAVYLGIMVLALDSADRSRIVPQLTAFPLLIWMILLWYFLVVLMMLCLGCDSVKGLLESELPRRRRMPDFAWALLCTAAGIGLGLADGTWLTIVLVTAGAVYVLLAVITCTKWFYRMGRGLFSRI